MNLYGSEQLLLLIGALITALLGLYVLLLVDQHRRRDNDEEARECGADADSAAATAASIPDLSRLGNYEAGTQPLLCGTPFIGTSPLAVAAAANANKATVTNATDSPSRQRQKRRRVRNALFMLFGLAVVGGVSFGIYILIKEAVKRPSDTGFEWTERYHGVMECGGETLMITRMRVFSYGKFVPVLRKLGSPDAHVLQHHYDAAFNPGLMCIKDTPHLIGSASSELHLSGGPPPGRVKVVNLQTNEYYFPSMQYDTCVDRFFGTCSMDGKWSVVDGGDGLLHGLIRANAWHTGGGRWLQHTSSADYGRTWSAFQLVSIDGWDIAANVNIYFALLLKENATHFRIRFPAVVPSGSGIWDAFSEDGIHYSEPHLLRSEKAYGPRVETHPVENGNEIAEINLHIDSRPVRVLRKAADGSLLTDERWKTNRFIWE